MTAPKDSDIFIASVRYSIDGARYSSTTMDINLKNIDKWYLNMRNMNRIIKTINTYHKPFIWQYVVE